MFLHLFYFSGGILKARVVELRYFSGLSIEETSEVLGISNVTVRRDWNTAKAWLYQQIVN